MVWMPQAHLCSVQDNTGCMLCKLFKSSNSQLVYSVLLVKSQHINTIHQKHHKTSKVQKCPNLKFHLQNASLETSLEKPLPIQPPPNRRWHLPRDQCSVQLPEEMGHNWNPHKSISRIMCLSENVVPVYIDALYISQFLFVIEHVLLWSLAVMFSMKQIVIWIPLRWGWGLCLGHPWWIWCCGTLSQVLSTGTLRFLLKNKLSCQAVTLSIYCFR